MPLQPEILLVDENYIKKYTWLTGSVDTNLLYPAIYLAQDEQAQRYLGTRLLRKLQDDLVASTLTPDYENLLYNYVCRVVCWWSLYEMIPHLYYKTDNGSLVVRITEDTQPITETVLQQYREQAKQKAEYYTERLKNFLCANSALFPEYNQATFPEIPSTDRVYQDSQFNISGGTTGQGFNSLYRPWYLPRR